nr:hypothetical protein [Cressdnaviricota sp.]
MELIYHSLYLLFLLLVSFLRPSLLRRIVLPILLLVELLIRGRAIPFLLFILT